MLADQLDLPVGQRDIFQGQGGHVLKQCLGTLEAQAVDGHLKAFGRLAQAALGLLVGLADKPQGQRRAVLHDLGNFAQRAATVVEGLEDPRMAGLRDRQVDCVQVGHPGIQGGGC